MEPMTKTPPKIDVGDWRSRIPAHLLAEAEAEGPLESDNTETPQQAAERRRIAQDALNAAYRAKVPVLYRDATLADLDADLAASVADWLERKGTTLMLAGPVGTGKTHAAYAVLAHLMAHGVTVQATTVSDLLAALRPEGDHRQAALARTAQVLLLDDMGATKASEWAQEQMIALLDQRLREGKRQIVTTNATYEQMAEVWDDRTMDRLRYRWAVVQVTGESRRKAAW